MAGEPSLFDNALISAKYDRDEGVLLLRLPVSRSRLYAATEYRWRREFHGAINERLRADPALADLARPAVTGGEVAAEDRARRTRQAERALRHARLVLEAALDDPQAAAAVSQLRFDVRVAEESLAAAQRGEVAGDLAALRDSLASARQRLAAAEQRGGAGGADADVAALRWNVEQAEAALDAIQAEAAKAGAAGEAFAAARNAVSAIISDRLRELRTACAAGVNRTHDRILATLPQLLGEWLVAVELESRLRGRDVDLAEAARLAKQILAGRAGAAPAGAAMAEAVAV